jgi:hypothetical protein
MTKGRSRNIKHGRKSTDQNDHFQTGQGEEIATPPAGCTSPRRGRPEEFTEMNPSNPLQTEEPRIGNDSFYAASAVSPNANHQDKTSSLFAIDRVAKPVPYAAQTMEDQQFEDPESQQQYLYCITQVWHREIHLSARRLEDYSDEAHFSTVWQEFNIQRLFFKTKMMKSLTMNPQMRKMSIHAFRTLQRPQSSQKIFL